LASQTSIVSMVVGLSALTTFEGTAALHRCCVTCRISLPVRVLEQMSLPAAAPLPLAQTMGLDFSNHYLHRPKPWGLNFPSISWTMGPELSGLWHWPPAVELETVT